MTPTTLLRSALLCGFVLLARPAMAELLPAEVRTLVSTQEFDFGAFCISDLGSGSVTVGQSISQPDGIWWPVKITINPKLGHKVPHAIFFDKPIPSPPNGMFESCTKRAKLRGDITPILEGQLNRGVISAYYRPASGAETNRWQIDPGGLDVEFGKVDTHLKRLFGAKLLPIGRSGNESLSGRKLWVTNPAKSIFFNLSASAQTGTIRIATTDVQLAGVTLAIGEDARVTTDLSCPYDPSLGELGRVAFDIDVTNGAFSFVAGQCFRDGLDFTAGQWRAAGLEADVLAAHADKFTLLGAEKGASINLENLLLNLRALRHGPAPSVVVTPTKPVQVASLRGSVANSEEIARLEGVLWSGLRTDDASVVLGDKAISGTASLDIRSISDDSMAGRIELSKPEIPVLTAVLTSASLEHLVLELQGKKAALQVRGALKLPNFRGGVLSILDQPQPLSFSLADTNDEEGVRFHFGLDLPGAMGRVTLTDALGQQISVEGQLKRLLLSGDFFSGGTRAAPRVRVGRGGLQAGLAVQVSRKPLLFGSTTQFVGASLAVSAPEGFEVGPGTSKGALELAAAGLVIPDPRLAFADRENNFKLAAPIRTVGAAALRMDLATGAVSLQSGDLHLEQVSGSAVSQQPISLAGIALTSPEISLGTLDVIAANGSGTVRGQGLTFKVKQVEHPGQPYWRVAMSAEQSFSLPSFEATLGQSQGAIDITRVVLHNLSLSASEGVFKTADGFAVTGHGISVSAGAISEDAIQQGMISIDSGSLDVSHQDSASVTHGKADLAGFRLSLDGPKDQISGSGSLRLQNISVGGTYALDVGPCPANQHWKVTGAVDISQADLSLTLDHGRVSGSSLDFSGGKAYVVNAGDDQRCEWDEPKTISEEKWAIFSLPCGLEGFPPHVKMCDVKTIIVPRVDIQIHWIAELFSLQVSGAIKSASLRLNGQEGLRICMRELTLNPPLINASYAPNFNQNNIPLVGNLVRDLIRGTATLFESSIANSFGDAASLTTWLQAKLLPSC